MDNTPHTPTPFKNALEKYGPLKPLVCCAAKWVCPVGFLGPCSHVWLTELFTSEISVDSPNSPEKLQIS